MVMNMTRRKVVYVSSDRVQAARYKHFTTCSGKEAERVITERGNVGMQRRRSSVAESYSVESSRIIMPRLRTLESYPATRMCNQPPSGLTH